MRQKCLDSTCHFLSDKRISNFCCSYIVEATPLAPASAHTEVYETPGFTCRAFPGCRSSLCPQSAKGFMSLGAAHSQQWEAGGGQVPWPPHSGDEGTPRFMLHTCLKRSPKGMDPGAHSNPACLTFPVRSGVTFQMGSPSRGLLPRQTQTCHELTFIRHSLGGRAGYRPQTDDLSPVLAGSQRCS